MLQLQCVVSHWDQYQSCSQCSLQIDEAALNLKKCRHIIRALFPEVHPSLVDSNEDVSTCSSDSPTITKAGHTITIIRLDGEATDVKYHPSKSIIQVKESVQKNMKIVISRQRLMYNGKELEVRY